MLMNFDLVKTVRNPKQNRQYISVQSRQRFFAPLLALLKQNGNSVQGRYIHERPRGGGRCARQTTRPCSIY